MNKQELWERAISFHGHVCPGLMIGFRASLYAAKLLKLHFSEDEEVVCIAENDSCSIAAIQSILGCTIGKGNMTRKQADRFASVITAEDRETLLKEARSASGWIYREIKNICGRQSS